MQKKLIALVVAGLASSAAFAQSNVTMYGVVDMGYARITADGVKSTSGIDNGLLGGSRLGFKGEEALGDGLKAVFALEYMLQPDSNTGVGATSRWTGTSARNTYVGLNGSFGTVLTGRLQGIGYAHACAYNSIVGSAWDAFGRLGAATVISCGTGGRHDNAVAWVSPNMSGFTVAYNHARLTETAATNVTGEDSTANVFGATYANGPLQVGFAYVRLTLDATAAADDRTEMGLGGSYDFGMLKLIGDYRSQKDEGKSRDKKWMIGATVPVSAAGSIGLQYGSNSIDSTAADDDAKAMALQYIHAMSKRTKAYAGYGRVNNSGTAKTGFGGVNSTVNGGDTSVLMFGVNHSF